MAALYTTPSSNDTPFSPLFCLSLAVSLCGGGRAVRGRDQHDERPLDTPHRHRVGGVGQPQRQVGITVEIIIISYLSSSSSSSSPLFPNNLYLSFTALHTVASTTTWLITLPTTTTLSGHHLILSSLLSYNIPPRQHTHSHSRFHEYMADYSPYDNVKAQDYPALLVTAGNP